MLKEKLIAVPMSNLRDIIKRLINRIENNQDIKDLEVEFNVEIVKRALPHLFTFSAIGFSLGFLIGRYIRR